ncbi:MAG TPA: hypothetical protein VF120_04570 [Ktedonobacterales bacterium]
MTARPQPDPAETLASISGSQLPTPKVSLADRSLVALFDRARSALLRSGELHETPRGFTRSLNGVVLTWVAPARDRNGPPHWRREEIDWYLDTFVARRPENDPGRPAGPDGIAFPYTYAARTRFWDGGWGYLAALTAALGAAGSPVAAIERAGCSRDDFEAFLSEMGERLHVQTLLALCALYPRAQLHRWLAEPDEVDAILRAWRRDLLANAIADVAATPESRRAVVASLAYPQLEDQLQPRMGLPPYQLFQFLPGEALSPLSSIHVHRSLDLDGGAPLDFYHDLAWLREASATTGRPLGDITVVAHNLHTYVRPDDEASGGVRESIGDWLCRVTDGYTTDKGTPRHLLALPAYRANVERIWSSWSA